MAEGFRVGLVQHSHTLEVHFAHFQNDGQQLLQAPVVHADGKQGFVQESVDGIILVPKNGCMVGISGNSTDAEQDQRLEGADILVSVPQLAHIIVVVSAASGSALVAFGNQLLLFQLHPVHNGQDGVIIKIHIGQSGKQALHDHGSGGIADNMFVALGCSCQTDQRTSQLILKFCGICFLATDTYITHTGFAAGGLFTLKTKHSQVSFRKLLLILRCGSFHHDQFQSFIMKISYIHPCVKGDL